ncbi:MAG: aspartate carbamoyltransferase catalytic subunit [Proteobacteria bacterium]|nr:MAG: aspartate carbamoyltransferase catalytic subunit [Pseudomonadota bacterium]
MRHLLEAAHLTREEIYSIFETARAFGPKIRNDESIPLLQGKAVVNLFYENSTRTRSSFEVAIRKLGGVAMNFAAASSSAAKGETLIDTALNLEAMRPHAIVVRHSSAGSPHFLTKYVSVPVINAGDGFHEHPTQGLLDALTIEEKLGTLEGKRVVILGDIAHSRVARSNIHILKKLGASVAVCAPPTLLPPKPETLGVDFAYRPEELLPDADVVMALRIQLERQNNMQIPSMREYSAFWGLNSARAKLMKKGAIILHPGPINRGVEIDTEVADGPNSVILDQVANGVLIRMAVLAQLVAPEKTAEWVKKARESQS